MSRAGAKGYAPTRIGGGVRSGGTREGVGGAVCDRGERGVAGRTRVTTNVPVNGRIEIVDPETKSNSARREGEGPTEGSLPAVSECARRPRWGDLVGCLAWKSTAALAPYSAKHLPQSPQEFRARWPVHSAKAAQTTRLGQAAHMVQCHLPFDAREKAGHVERRTEAAFRYSPLTRQQM